MFADHKKKQLAVPQGGDGEEVYLNLTPMIDVLTTLLFFLLLSFGAIVIALINATVPALSEGGKEDNKPPDKKIKVTMTVSISDKGLSVIGDAELPEADLKQFQKTFPLIATGYNFPGLTEHLAGIKRRYPESETVILIPDADIPYQVLVQALDATRERVDNSAGKQLRVPLFPGAVVSSIVK